MTSDSRHYRRPGPTLGRFGCAAGVAAEAPGRYCSGASDQTRQDLADIEHALAEAERLRSVAAAKLAAVRARGDGEVAVGMPLAQHLRHTTRLGRDTVTAISVLGDVLGDLPGLAHLLGSGRISMDQAAAVARHAARVGTTLRRALDTELSDQDVWHNWSPEHLAAETGRILASLTPALTVAEERDAPSREFLYLQPSLDGRAVDFRGRYEGLNAAIFDSVLFTASPEPRKGVRRGPQLAAGLACVLTDWAVRSHGRHRDQDGPSTPPATIHLLIDEHTATDGAAAELWTHTPGLAPLVLQGRRWAAARRAGVVDVLVGASKRNGRSRVSGTQPIQERQRGHRARPAIAHGPPLMAACRMPGCDRPIGDIHHLVHRAKGGKDRTSNLAGLCRRCHHRVLHGRGWTGHVDTDGVLHLKRHDQTLTTPARKHLRLRRPPPLADPTAAANESPTHYDQHGQPLPF